MRRKIFVCILLLGLLPAGATACIPDLPTALATDTPRPTPTKITGNIFQTDTPAPSKISQPIGTPAASLAAAQTPVDVTSTDVTPAGVTPTVSIYSTPAIGYDPVPAGISPSGRWVAWRVDCQDRTEDVCFQFSDRDSRQVWHLTEDDVRIRFDLPYTFTAEVAHWSSDYRYVYLATYPQNFENTFPAVNGIIQFSLVNGLHSYVLEPAYQFDGGGGAIQSPVLYRIGFSNDSRWLAYASQNGTSIDFTLQYLYSGEEQTFSVAVSESSVFGDITWSPEDDAFVFSVSKSMVGSEISYDFSVFAVRLEDLTVKTVFAHGDLFLSSPEWVSNNEVRYTYMGPNGETGRVVLNIETGVLTDVGE